MGSISFIAFVVPNLTNVWDTDFTRNIKDNLNALSKYVNIFV